jgi:hypothetical protein
MPFPLKFKELIELTLNDVEMPDYVWLTYAVCVMENDACGWQGWIIESAFKITTEDYPTGTGDKLLPTSSDECVCPSCGRGLFRTQASVKFEPSIDQAPVHGIPGIDYKVADIDYY